MDRKYNLKLDLQFRCNNSKMIFDEFDENTSNFFMQINRQGQEVDISNAIPTLLVLKPSGTAVSQILNIKDNLIYGNLENSLKDEVGTYIAKLMLVEGDKKTFISNISYEVTENALLGMIDNDIVKDERYSVLLQLLERLSNIEIQEQTRVDNENSRVEAEKLREESIEKIKNDIENLITETNKKVNDNLNSNTSKIDNLIIDTKEELNKYKNNKDIAINEDLKEFKENTSKSIENYKTSKDVEINNSLNTYKTNTTNDINSFKNTVNSKIDKYKNDKDKAINEHIKAKELELDNYVEAKNKEIDNYKTSKSNELDLYVSEKNTLIDSKISEVNNAKTQMQDSINNKLIEVDNAEQIRQQEHEGREEFLNSFEGKLNTVVDDVATVKDDVVAVKEANKRQDVFLQGLYNENLDGRITVKEEGSVISLTNSDDGLVDIVGLEGNTLVNYVQDGAKELTLNDEIDTEGTSVTLTEGADNGLVDVACEGNTLVNLMGKYTSLGYATYNSNDGSFVLNQTSTKKSRITFDNALIEPNKTYTVQFNIVKNTMVNSNTESNKCAKLNLVSFKKGAYTVELGTVGVIKVVLTQPSETTHNGKPYFETFSTTTGELIVKDFIALEGDWTNKEIPQYFEGMKSVGECEDNKIELMSNTKNIVNTSLWSDTGIVDGRKVLYGKGWLPHQTSIKIPLNVKKGVSYFVSAEGVNAISSNLSRMAFGKGTNSTTYKTQYVDVNANVSYQTKNVVVADDDYDFVFFDFQNNTDGNYIFEDNFIICKSNDINEEFEYYKSNKKEITLSEPLRALPNGVKDKIVKIGGKHYVERNLCEYKITGEEDIFTYDANKAITQYYITGLPNMIVSTSTVNGISDKFTFIKSDDRFNERSHNHLWCGNSHIALMYLKSANLTTSDVQSLLKGTTVIYQLATPTYEEITDPTVNTYNDITHISNNSTIPCNMKIQNTGYNAIIKPSTQYTVAFDTNTSGTVGINLAGSKVTTNNNVATVTTPATLTDYSLRLYGKDIKASNVRLLEGDKTNYIPSFFEGMKSCFEENLQEDKSYKVEIISSNLDNSKSNKLQLQLNEPLRAVGDIKDKLVFEDNKLMVQRNCGIREYQEGDFELDSTLTDRTNTTYILNEPTYEEVPYETQKLILKCFENGTLFLDTNIPPTVTASYTANIPLVSKVNKVNEVTETNTEDIAITQMAVDFLLMSSLGEEMLNFKIKSGYNMASYFASRIIKGALKYEDVVNKYPQYKEDINSILISEGYSDLIIEL